jgi:hypothetical protein
MIRNVVAGHHECLDFDCVQALKCHLPEVNTIRDRFKGS